MYVLISDTDTNTNTIFSRDFSTTEIQRYRCIGIFNTLDLILPAKRICKVVELKGNGSSCSIMWGRIRQVTNYLEFTKIVKAFTIINGAYSSIVTNKHYITKYLYKILWFFLSAIESYHYWLENNLYGEKWKSPPKNLKLFSQSIIIMINDINK